MPERVLDELAQVVIDKIDQLLDRVTDRAVGADAGIGCVDLPAEE